MTMRRFTTLAIAAALSSGGCTVSQTTPPPLTGPADFATSLVVTPNPDTLVLNGQASVVTIEARDASGAPLPQLRVHLDTVVNGLAASCGRLSVTDVTTGSDGRANVVFTAPVTPLPLPECSNLGAEGSLVIRARPIGLNTQTFTSFTAGIRFLPSSSSPQASSVFAVNFLMSPNPGAVGAEITFSDAGSVSPGHTITSFQWTFSDGVVKNGPTVMHDFGAPGVYTVGLTIKDDIGQEGSKNALITIN
jgi:hypothetical protein